MKYRYIIRAFVAAVDTWMDIKKFKTKAKAVAWFKKNRGQYDMLALGDMKLQQRIII